MNRHGFTLTEVLMATAIFSMVTAGAAAVYLACTRIWYDSDLRMRTAYEASTVLQKMVYGISGTNGMRAAISTNVAVSSGPWGWRVTYSTPDAANYGFIYRPGAANNGAILASNFWAGGDAVVIGTNIVASAVTTNSGGLNVTVSVGIEEGRFSSTNTMSTYVHYRN